MKTDMGLGKGMKERMVRACAFAWGLARTCGWAWAWAWARAWAWAWAWVVTVVAADASSM